ncbi:MAG: enolase C-terminal domain-like protein [Desulfobacterales bacterium]
MNLTQAEIYHLRIPFRIPFKHNLAAHKASNTVVLKLTTAEGVVGYGEGVPRKFVTGESLGDTFHLLQSQLIPGLARMKIVDANQVWLAVAQLINDSHRAVAPAACCALELAILDCVGKQWGRSLADLLPPSRHRPRYSAVLPLTDLAGQRKLLSTVRHLALSQVKLKVGGDRDLARVTQARVTLGPEADIRLDANGAWSAPEAVERIQALLPLGISAVEQPVAKTDWEGLKAVCRKVPLPIIADESLCTREDAARLSAMERGPLFNIRISKCGGIQAAVQLYDHARRNGRQSQLGCQVGETGILAAAGRHLAAAFDFKYLEGAFGPLLLEQDIVHEPVVFGPGGEPPALPGPGLGVTVDEQRLAQYTAARHSIPLHPRRKSATFYASPVPASP